MRWSGLFVPVVLSAGVWFSGCASTDWERSALEKEQEARALREQYDALAQQEAERQAAAEALKTDLDRARSEVDALAADIDGLSVASNAVAATDPELDALKAEYERLKAKYDEVRINGDGNLEITLDSNVTFASGSHKLTAEGRRILDQVAQDLKGSFAKNLVEVIGHTDSDPIRKSGYADNLELGGERAFEVARYFATNHGIERTRLVASSRGDTEPVADNSTPDGKRKNRRVEIVVVFPKAGETMVGRAK